ncbi:NAD(P)-binding domain-containing protein [Burkholderia anthina]|uniref:NAD(P)-binding domain-containing protein n=1 Tax=Burkholderia anthina TaxID=179879 RepID=UPI00158F209E|nr:NAD(P)-binding domain-containing protein [Burkholderia anthina]
MTGVGKDGHVARVAILGAGHLGIAIAARLVREGGGEGTVVRLGNRGSALSRERAAAAGVAHLLTDVASAIDGAEVLPYTVRPTDIAMLGGYALKRD